MGLLKFGQKKWDESSRKKKESRGLKVFTGFFNVFLKCFFNDFELDPTFVFEIVIAIWNKFWQQSCQIFSLPAVESSDFIFVAGMYPEIEN